MSIRSLSIDRSKQIKEKSDMMSTIVVYGGELPAVCAAAKAAAKCSTATVHVIVPYASGKLGGIATVGGQNYWDIPTNVPAYANSNLPQRERLAGCIPVRVDITQKKCASNWTVRLPNMVIA